jgi:hypothetical protein
MTGLQDMNPNLIRQYSSAFGAYVPGEYQIGEQIATSSTSGTVIWSYLGANGLTYVIDDNSGWPVEVQASQVNG